MGLPTTTPTIRPPDTRLRSPATPLPPGSCDCHAHVFGPADRFPYAATRAYTPVDAPTPMYVAQLRALGCDRAVLVQPSCYGTDNSAMLDALRSGAFAFRGVAVISGHEPDEELAALHAAGVRGIRLNLYTRGALLSLDDAQRLAARVRPFGWHLQIYASLPTLDDLDGLLRRLDRPVVIDHLGHPDVAAGAQAPGFKALTRALADGRCWVKQHCPTRERWWPPTRSGWCGAATGRTPTSRVRCPTMPNWPTCSASGRPMPTRAGASWSTTPPDCTIFPERPGAGRSTPRYRAVP